MTHKEWLDNEYAQWIKALQESTVYNFKEHPMVKRMLGEVERNRYIYDHALDENTVYLLQQIDRIGRDDKSYMTDGTCQRMIYWAQQVLKQNPKSIVEIGGGVGEFYAILRALGYKGEYYIYDFTEVKHFQHLYLEEVSKQTGLNIKLSPLDSFDMVVSFYALGEFTDEIKKWYLQDHSVTANCPHGFIVWNPQSGASPEFPATKHQITIEPTIEEGIKLITW